MELTAQADPAGMLLPQVRPDLEFHPGPHEPDGSPTINVLDPLTGQFAKLGWIEAAVLERLRSPKTIGQLIVELARDTTIDLTPDEVMMFCAEAAQAQLTIQSSFADPAMLSAQADARKTHPLTWLLHHYLYFRIPFLHPDRLLEQTLPLARLLVSRLACLVYALAALAGLYFLTQKFADFRGTFNYLFTTRGMVVFGITMILVKVIHEFAHAYTAKALGVRVPVMGVAFMVMWPVAFCDVTAGWKLSRRSDRLKISTAGVCAELVLAALAMCCWGLTLPGILKTTFFTVSSVTLISTLMVNFNPAMRFDGYYILGDLWGIDNLQQRSFAMSRWALYRWFLGVDMPPPESDIRFRRLLGMVVYSLYAWGYRILLYLGIAVLVYYKFWKVLGAFLFSVEVTWFLIRPVLNEGKIIFGLREHLRLNVRLLLVLGTLVGGFLWLALPLPRTISVPAIVIEDEGSQTIYAPADGIVKNLTIPNRIRQRAARNAAKKINRGNITADPIVTKDQALFTIHTDFLVTELVIGQKEIEILEIELRLLSLDPRGRGQLPERREALRQVKLRFAALQRQTERNTARAKLTGSVYEWDTSVRDGMYVRRDQILGRIADLSKNRVVAFLHEDYVASIKPGSTIHYRAAGSLEMMRGTVAAINPVREKFAKHRGLASLAHGDLPVLQGKNGEMILQATYYKVDIALADGHPPLHIGQTGRAFIRTAGRSRLLDGARQAWRVVLRESGF